MIKIIKYGCEYKISKNSLTSIDAKYDGIIIVLNDGTELRFNMSVSQQLQSIFIIVKSNTTSDVTLNLDAAISGQYDRVLSLG